MQLDGKRRQKHQKQQKWQKCRKSKLCFALLRHMHSVAILFRWSSINKARLPLRNAACCTLHELLSSDTWTATCILHFCCVQQEVWRTFFCVPGVGGLAAFGVLIFHGASRQTAWSLLIMHGKRGFMHTQLLAVNCILHSQEGQGGAEKGCRMRNIIFILCRDAYEISCY